MGQYYHTVNMEIGEYLHPHRIDCGLKMGEILGSCYRVCDMVAIMLAHNEGPSDRPGDLFLEGVTGRWAGHPVFYVGDYAASGDMPNWRWKVPEEDVYGALGSDGDDGEDQSDFEWTDVSDLAKPVMERASGYAWAGSTIVETTPRSGGGHTVLVPADANEYYRKSLLAHRPAVEARTDLSFITENERADGQRRLMVNLDKHEYVDPVAFGETPTLAGILAGMPAVYDDDGWSSLQALNSMLFYNVSRGGGDREGKMVGRWRGDRIVIIGDRETAAFPGIAQVRESFTDISAEARAGALR